MTTNLDDSTPFPLQTLSRAVKQRPTYLLGLCGVRSFSHLRNAGPAGLPSEEDSHWEFCIKNLLSSMAQQWGKSPILVNRQELTTHAMNPAPTRNRYSDAESITRWRSIPLCVLDLGCDDVECVKKYGRQCDGVAMIVLGGLHEAKLTLRQFRREAIPWLGYWTVAMCTDLEDNTNRERVRRVA